jgi:hypothetical protein
MNPHKQAQVRQGDTLKIFHRGRNSWCEITANNSVQSVQGVTCISIFIGRKKYCKNARDVR